MLFSHSILSLCDPWTAVVQASLPILHHLPELLKLISTESVMPSNHLVLCHPLLLLPSIFLSIRVFSDKLAIRIRWPKYWSFSFSISLSNKYSGLVFFSVDWFDLFAVPRTLKSPLQHHNMKASILQHLAFFMDQLKSIQDYWKTTALTIWTFAGKVMQVKF